MFIGLKRMIRQQLLGTTFVMFYLYWVENDDLKTTTQQQQQDLNVTDSVQKKIWLGNQMMSCLS